MHFIVKIFWFISSAMLIFFGFYFLGNPGIAVISLAFWIGFSILFNGIMTVGRFFSPESKKSSGLLFFYGLICIAFGCFILFGNNFVFFAALMPFFFGVWMTVQGIISVIHSLAIKKNNVDRWYLPFISGIAGFIIGVLSLLNPLISVFAIEIILGLNLIISGFTSFFLLIVAGKPATTAL